MDRPEVVLGLTVEGARQEVAEATTLVFGGIPDLAVAGRTGPEAGTVRLCSATLGYDGLFGDPGRRVEHLDWERNGYDELLGHGWQGRYPDRLRRVVHTTAELLLPIWRREAVQVAVTAAPPEWMPTDQLRVMQLEVNGEGLESYPMSSGWTTYSWTIPARSIRESVSRVSLHMPTVDVDPDDINRPRGIRVRDVRLTLGG